MGKYHCTVDLLFDWFGVSCMTMDNFCFYLQNRLIQTTQTGGQWYSEPPLVFPGQTILERKTTGLCIYNTAHKHLNIILMVAPYYNSKKVFKIIFTVLKEMKWNEIFCNFLFEFGHFWPHYRWTNLVSIFFDKIHLLNKTFSWAKKPK